MDELAAAMPMVELSTSGVVVYIRPPLVLWDDIRTGRLSGVQVQGCRLARALARRKNRPATTATLTFAHLLGEYATGGSFKWGLPFMHPAGGLY